VRHPDVHEDDVGLPGQGEFDRFDPVGGFPDDVDV
jgi:hypothetical protein